MWHTGLLQKRHQRHWLTNVHQFQSTLGHSKPVLNKILIHGACSLCHHLCFFTAIVWLFFPVGISVSFSAIHFLLMTYGCRMHCLRHIFNVNCFLLPLPTPTPLCSVSDLPGTCLPTCRRLFTRLQVALSVELVCVNSVKSLLSI